MVIKRVESERLVLRWQDGRIVVSSRETGEVLGTASLEPGDEATTWTLSVWMEDAAEDALAILTTVGLDHLGAELVEVIALADDESGAEILQTLGYSRADRALAGDEGPVVDRWCATLSAWARRVVPTINVERAADVLPAWMMTAGGARTEALAHYAD